MDVCVQMGGAQRAALRLEEAGHAVFGYTMSLDTPGGIHRLLDSFERREYSPSFYERDVVEVHNPNNLVQKNFSLSLPISTQ